MRKLLTNCYKAFGKYIETHRQLTLEHRFLNLFSVAGIVLSIFTAIINSIAGYHILTVIVPIVAGLITLKFLCDSLTKGSLKVLYFIGVYLVSFVMYPILWTTGGGVRTSMPFFIIMQTIFIGFLTSKYKRNIAFLIYLFLFSGLVGIEYIWPELFEVEVGRKALFFDYGFSLILVSSICYLIMRIITREYNKSQMALEELSKKNIELAAASEQAYLNAQIKPHFLYNALNTIAACCSNDGKQAEELIISLSTYLRGTLDFENLDRMISLDRELSLVRAYVEIEKARFNNLSVKIEVDPKIYVMLPPMTIQPLVENAIKHGVRNCFSQGIVAIGVKQTSDGVEVFVSDNGKGIAKDIKIDILEKNHNKRSVGLFNINKRLEDQFGKGLIIESELGVGTRVSFLIVE